MVERGGLAGHPNRMVFDPMGLKHIHIQPRTCRPWARTTDPAERLTRCHPGHMLTTVMVGGVRSSVEVVASSRSRCLLGVDGHDVLGVQKLFSPNDLHYTLPLP